MIPADHSKGYYTFGSPFDVAIQPNTLLTCRGSITLPQLEKEGLEPFKTVYEPFGMTQAEYEEDVLNKVSIVILSPGKGTIYVPSDRILSMSQVDRIPYNKALIGINLGTLPTDLNIDTLMDDIKYLIEERLGITPAMSKNRDGDTIMVTKDEHDSILAARALVSTNPQNYKVQVAMLDNELDKKGLLIDKLTVAIAGSL